MSSRHRAEQCQNCPSYHKHLPGRRMGMVPHFFAFPAMMGTRYTPTDLGDVGYCFSLYQVFTSFANIISFLKEVVSHCGYCAVYVPSQDVAKTILQRKDFNFFLLKVSVQNNLSSVHILCSAMLLLFSCTHSFMLL